MQPDLRKQAKIELLWLAGLFLIPVIGFIAFLVLRHETTISVQLIDTYYVLSGFRILILLITKLVFITFLIRTLKNRFRILPQNIVLLAAAAFLVIIYYLVIREFIYAQT